MICVQLLVLDVRWIMLITNSSLVIPHNLIHKYKHALVNKGFKFFVKVKTKQHTNFFLFKKNWKKFKNQKNQNIRHTKKTKITKRHKQEKKKQNEKWEHLFKKKLKEI